MATSELYARCLDAVLKCEGQLKDDTYLLHLVTETAARLTTLADLTECGIIDCINKILVDRLTDSPELVTFALQLARLVVPVTCSSSVSGSANSPDLPLRAFFQRVYGIRTYRQGLHKVVIMYRKDGDFSK